MGLIPSRGQCQLPPDLRELLQGQALSSEVCPSVLAPALILGVGVGGGHGRGLCAPVRGYQEVAGPKRECDVPHPHLAPRKPGSTASVTLPAINEP